MSLIITGHPSLFGICQTKLSLVNRYILILENYDGSDKIVVIIQGLIDKQGPLLCGVTNNVLGCI